LPSSIIAEDYADFICIAFKRFTNSL